MGIHEVKDRRGRRRYVEQVLAERQVPWPSIANPRERSLATGCNSMAHFKAAVILPEESICTAPSQDMLNLRTKIAKTSARQFEHPEAIQLLANRIDAETPVSKETVP